MQGQPLVEGLGRVDRVLPQHRVADEQHAVRGAALVHLLELLHERLVDVEPTGRIQDHDVMAVLLGVLDAATTDLGRPRGHGLRVDRDAELLAERLQLLHGRGPLQVGGDQQRVLLLVLAQEQRELAAGRRLAAALQAAHHEHERRRVRSRQPDALAAEQVGQRVVEYLDELLARIDRRDDVLTQGALLDVGDELLGDLVVDVGLEQGLPDGADPVLDVLLGEHLLADDGPVGIAQGAGERVEHGAGRMGPPPPRVKARLRRNAATTCRLSC